MSSPLYALARRIDDIGDGDGEPAASKLRRPGQRPASRSASYVSEQPTRRRSTDDPVLIGRGRCAPALPRCRSAALEELIEGCEMDVIGTRYETFDDLVGYCRRVAGTVGRL